MGKSKKELLSNAIFGSPAYNMLNGIKKNEDEANTESKEINPQYNQQPIVNVSIEEKVQNIPEEQVNDELTIELSENAIPSYTQSDNYEEPIVQRQPNPTQTVANNSIYNNVVNTVQPLTRNNYIKTNPVKSKKVCYLITPHIHQSLERIASESSSSVNQLVNDIFNHFIDHYDQ